LHVRKKSLLGKVAKENSIIFGRFASGISDDCEFSLRKNCRA
jgi:hypothetical protein